MSAKQYTANQVYKVVKDYELTQEQQAAVQDAPTDSPTLVVAGAGSGKTELMAVRVMWLVANGIARPEEILGLTFTRKAAAELSKRIYDSLLKLRDTPMWPEDLEYDFSPPVISTYNAYANNLFRDNALAIGYESDAVLLTEAAAYQLAREVVVKHGSQIDSRINEIDWNLNSIVESVLAMAQSMTDNLVDESDVEREIEMARVAISDLPQKSGSTNTEAFSYISQVVQPLSQTPVIAKLAAGYQAEKKRQGFVDYADQVALAELAVRIFPEVGQQARSIHKQVLLDEYQDTSFLQTRLLQNLFAGTAVFAVGDPNQSIYGWRGASASNLSSFHNDFRASENTKRFTLSTSWRNPKQVLTLANHLIDSLKVVELAASPSAKEGHIQIDFSQDIETEAKVSAEWFKQRLTNDSTAALLMRKRSQMPTFVAALEAEGLEVEVVGLGGLLEMPEVVDLVSALKVIHNPASGSALIRLLAGPRWRIGAKDLERLHHYANRKSKVADELREKINLGLAPEDALSLVDALDLLLEDNQDLTTIGFSDLALSRLRDAAQLFQKMRQQTGLGLVEFVRSVEQELWLDIEVQANPRRKNPMAHLNAFAAIVAGFANSNNQPHLGGFLSWLEFADEKERFEAPNSSASQGVVQVLTIHAAKGLEWDYVAIANLIDGDFPSTGKGTSGWLGVGKLPYPLRGDSASLPVWNYSNCSTQPEVKSTIDAFKLDMKAHLLNEELRLMYVATTRPKKELLLTGSYWKAGSKNSRPPSPFLISACELMNKKIDEIESQENPLELVAAVEQWPLDPLGERHRINLERAAKQVSNGVIEDDSTIRLEEIQAVHDGDKIQQDIDLLLMERQESFQQLEDINLPVRIPASSFKDFIADFEATSQRIRRPMPQAPYKQTRSGTLFHSWVEGQFGFGQFFGEQSYEDSGLETLESLAYENIEQLQQNFSKSRFAKMTPLDVEREIQFTIGQNTFICKLDAVFETDSGVLIVDWKTGKAPKDKADEKLRSLQLALYRLAYSQFTGMPIEKVEVCFYFVAEDLELVPEDIADENELMTLWSQVLAS
jgi:DNA helicase II / ATP-dependent DNA helicase PcrA